MAPGYTGRAASSSSHPGPGAAPRARPRGSRRVTAQGIGVARLAP